MAVSCVIQFASALLYGKGGGGGKTALCARAEALRVVTHGMRVTLYTTSNRRRRWVS